MKDACSAHKITIFSLTLHGTSLIIGFVSREYREQSTKNLRDKDYSYCGSVEGERKDSFDGLVNQAFLDVKAMMILSSTVQDPDTLIKKKFIESPDEDIRNFRMMLSESTPTRQNVVFVMGIGEMILAVFLSIFGLIFSIPAVLGYDSVTTVGNYFQGVQNALYQLSSSYPITAFLDFVVAVLLLVAAFFSLKQAAYELKRVGLRIQRK